MLTNDVLKKRAILLTARIRFSPHVQTVKEGAIDRIVEQTLFATTDRGSGVNEIRESLAVSTGGYAISPSEIRSSIGRLAAAGRVTPSAAGHSDSYTLSPAVKQEISEIQKSAEIRFNSVVNRLFKDAPGGSSVYAAAFLKCLSLIFSEFGEESARLIKGDIKGEEFLAISSLPVILAAVQREFRSIDHQQFEQGILTFFRDADPEYGLIKWNMAQNYYLIKALGLDPTGLLLSREIFENTTFYLDTNIVISALEPRERYHKSFLTFADACKQLGINLAVCEITLEELRRWLDYQQELLEKVVDQIPEATAPRVQSTFLEVLRERRQTEARFDVSTLFERYQDPAADLKTLFGIDTEDDSWFDEARESSETVEFAQTLRERFRTMRGRPKASAAALHDALIVRWLEKTRQEVATNDWFITADRTLPGAVPAASSFTSLAITTEAVLQWISPLVTANGEAGAFSEIFADMIRHRILPQDRLFELEDFQVFHELHMSCKELPAEDVEACIRYLKVRAATLDPSNPVDRERLAYEVSKFFADPARKYKQDVSRLEAALRDRDNGIESLKRELSEAQEGARRTALKTSAQLRMGLTIFLLMVLEALVLLAANAYGEGMNSLQKLQNSWNLFAGVAAAVVVFSWFFIGKERLRILGWPFDRIFRA